MTEKISIVFTLYPNKRGFGFACLEWPQKIIDCGVVTVRPIYNPKLFKNIIHLLEFYKPKLIILRDCKNLSAAERSQKLIDEISIQASERGIKVFHYSRQQVRDVFEQFGATTKYEIAQKIIEWFPELACQMPKMRKPWMDEDYHMGVFDAVALAVTHKYLNE